MFEVGIGLIAIRVFFAIIGLYILFLIAKSGYFAVTSYNKDKQKFKVNVYNIKKYFCFYSAYFLVMTLIVSYGNIPL